MSTNHTEHYNLSLWEPDDQVTRTEFNENHAKIDAALGALTAGQLRLHCGSYMGTGTTDFSFEIPCTPKVMLLHKTGWKEEKLLLIGDTVLAFVQTQEGLTLCKTNGDRFNFSLTGNTVHIKTSFESGFCEAPYIFNMKNVTYVYFILS